MDFVEINRDITSVNNSKTNIKNINNDKIYDIEEKRVTLKKTLKKYIPYYNNIFTNVPYYKQLINYFSSGSDNNCYLGRRKDKIYCDGMNYDFIYMSTFPYYIINKSIK